LFKPWDPGEVEESNDQAKGTGNLFKSAVWRPCPVERTEAGKVNVKEAVQGSKNVVGKCS
jgi:hypothetical protein